VYLSQHTVLAELSVYLLFSVVDCMEIAVSSLLWVICKGSVVCRINVLG